MAILDSTALQETERQIKSLGHVLETSATSFGYLKGSSALEPVQSLVQKMDEDGYLYLKGFWHREQVQRVRDSITSELSTLGFLDSKYSINEAKFAGREVGRALGNPLSQQNPFLRELLFGSHILNFFRQFLSSDVRHFDFIWYRTKGPGLGSPLHCDLVYMGRGTHQLYTAWVPLGDINLSMGGLIVLENSHKQKERLKPYLSRDVDAFCSNRPDAELYASGEKWWDGTLSKNPPALRKAMGGRWLTSREFQMGDALIFDMTLVHGSLDNQTDQFRLSTDTRYQRASDPIDERWIGEKPPGHAASQKRGRVC